MKSKSKAFERSSYDVNRGIKEGSKVDIARDIKEKARSKKKGKR